VERFSLEGRAAIVTGASRGIGRAIALELAHRGAVVVGTATREEGAQSIGEALAQAGGKGAGRVLDVRDARQCDELVGAVQKEFGDILILVNNAAITGGRESGLPSETPLAILRQVYETNVFGVVAVTNAMLPLLRRSPAARIVNVSSEVGSIRSALDRDGPLWPMLSIPYVSSKTALNMITAQYAKEL